MRETRKEWGRCETCDGEGVCEYVVGKIEEGKKKGRKKRGGLMTYDLWLVTCTCVEGKIINKKIWKGGKEKKKKVRRQILPQN